ncbi:MAG: ABC transporter permease [Bryobacteraceae bacterium]
MRLQDFRFVVRNLMRRPAFLITAVSTLALGIGATTAIFTLTNQILLRLIPVKDPNRLVTFHWTGQFIGGSTRGYEDSFSYPMYKDLREGAKGVTAIAAQYQDYVDVSDKGPSQRATAELVSGNYFEVLGVTAAMGRLFTPEEDKLKGGEPYVVLSHDFWYSHYGADHSVLNHVIDVNGHPMTVIGVAQPGFQGLQTLSPADLFVPLMMKAEITPTWDDMERRDSIWLRLFARLQPGSDIRTVESPLGTAYRTGLENDLATNSRDRDFSAHYRQNHLRLVTGEQGFGSMREFFAKPPYVLLAIVAALLLIASVNVANLLITRAAARQNEISIRLALGATRGSLIGLVMIESAVIAMAGGLFGLMLSDWIASVLVRFLPFENVAFTVRTAPDIRVLICAAGLTVFTALLAGLAPALQSLRPGVAHVVKQSARGLSLGSGQTQFRRVMICGQVALSFLLLAAAGLFARSLYKLMMVNTGMDTEHLLGFSIDPSRHNYRADRARRLYLDLQNRLERIPGVRSASAASFAVLSGENWQNTVHIKGYQPAKNEDMNPGWNEMLPGFFSAAGAPLVAGRDFTERDTAGSTSVVIVNETFQKRFFPHGSPIGRHIGWGGSGPANIEIVGVVKDIKNADLKEKPRPWTFTALLQNPTPGPVTFYVRTARSPIDAARAVQQAVYGLDAALPVFDVKTLRTRIDETHFLDRLLAWLSVSFGFLATLLAAIGLYGTTAFSVARRTQEIGIRVALGALRGNVLRLVMSEVLLLAGLGLAVGLVAVVAAGRLIESQLFEMKASDPVVIAVTAAVILAVSALAGYLPARRASRIDPMQALRWD